MKYALRNKYLCVFKFPKPFFYQFENILNVVKVLYVYVTLDVRFDLEKIKKYKLLSRSLVDH